jgi:hypothetical protein
MIYTEHKATRRRAASFFISAICAFGLLTSIGTTKAMAQGDLLISPLRVIFEGSKKIQEINLANTGNDTASYVITMVNLKMKEDGSFEQVDTPEPGQNFAEKYVRFFPHRVVLAPGEAQVVKAQLVRTNDLAAGEYRSHMYFRSVPSEHLQGDTTAKKDTTAISIKLTPIYGITIPIIVRVGETTSNVTLSDLSLVIDSTTNVPTLHLTFNRTGNISVYGDLTVDHISPKGKTTQAKLIKGIGVYTPNPARHAKFDMDTDKNIDYHTGTLHVTYTLQTSDKTTKKAEADIQLK